MAGKALEAGRGIVISTADIGEAAGDLGAVAYSYGALGLTSGFIITATVALNEGGLPEASAKIRERSHAGVAVIYDRTQVQEDRWESPSSFARRMAINRIGGVMLHPTSDSMAAAMMRDLQDREVATIVDIGIAQDATSFDVTEVWDTAVGAAVDQGIRYVCSAR